MSDSEAVSRELHVGLFTECDEPIVNGVVASVGTLRSGLADAGCRVTTIAPSYAVSIARNAAYVRLPSLPLPTSTGYRLCVPYVPALDRATFHAIDIAHAHSPFVTGWLAAATARRRGLPLVFTYHTRIDEYVHYAPFAPRVTRAAMIALTRAYANACDVTIVPTQPMEARLRELGVVTSIAIVPTAIDVARFAGAVSSRELRARMSGRRHARVALLVARLAAEKNVVLAVDALAHAPDVDLAIAGDGPLRDALRAHVRARGLDERVRFLGELAPEHMPAAYASADAFAFSSTSETQGLVLAEALAAGLPIVAVRSAVTCDVLGAHGQMVPAEAAAFGAALAAAVRIPRDSAGTAAAATRFEHAGQTLRILAVYRDALQLVHAKNVAQSAVHLALQ
jgi:1,2-diacylglycerol 3-alpha-glucosyltransferase